MTPLSRTSQATQKVLYIKWFMYELNVLMSSTKLVKIFKSVMERFFFHYKVVINIMFYVIDDNGDEERVEDIVDHSEDSTGSDLLLNSDGSPDRIGALNLVNFYKVSVITKIILILWQKYSLKIVKIRC